jgi:carbonic anhydrase
MNNDIRTRLLAGNKKYIETVDKLKLQDTADNGQHPFAIVVCCSDSRVIPEQIFDASIGDIFVIRVAGNVLDRHQLGSIEYAADHLGTKLILVLGHTRCGAVDSAIKGHAGGFIDSIVRDIELAIGGETDPYKASCLNVKHGVEVIRHELEIHPVHDPEGLVVAGAIYNIEDGSVEFLD